MATAVMQAVVIDGPRKGDLISLDMNGQEVVPDERLAALQELNSELSATVKELRDLRLSFNRSKTVTEQAN